MDNNKFGFKFQTTYNELPKELFKMVETKGFDNPQLVLFNENLANSLDLDTESLKKSGASMLSASEDTQLLAMAYSGHQFGHFTTLGDGRALLLGEHVNKSGNRFDIQLKGPGRTPYSRSGDGLASLGPMLREYLISEAMHGLNIPTTRSLAVVKTNTPVYRNQMEHGAVLTRVAKAHIRVGTFQHIATNHDLDYLKLFTDYTINRLYPELNESQSKYVEFLKIVTRKQANLLAKWQLNGFVHGVMNTDNMSICGETIDYGPCAFMDTYKLNTVFSSIDRQGRYCYGNQPYMAKWNLTRFAESILPLLSEDKNKGLIQAQSILEDFAPLYQSYWIQGMGKKLGLKSPQSEDLILFNTLLKIMEEEKLDYTNTFVDIAIHDFKHDDIKLNTWLETLKKRLELDSQSLSDAKNLMMKTNPIIIPRNYWVEDVLNSAINGDFNPFIELNEQLYNPFNQRLLNSKYRESGQFNKPYVTYCGT